MDLEITVDNESYDELVKAIKELKVEDVENWVQIPREDLQKVSDKAAELIEENKDLREENIRLKNSDGASDKVIKELMHEKCTLEEENKSLKERNAKASAFLLDYVMTWDYTANEYKYANEVISRVRRILDGNEYEHEFELPKEDINYEENDNN